MNVRHARAPRSIARSVVVLAALASMILLVALAGPFGAADTCMRRGGHWEVQRHRLDPTGPYRTQPYCVGPRAPHQQYDVPADPLRSAR